MLMRILISRLLVHLKVDGEAPSEEALERSISSVAGGLGLVVRLEQYMVLPVESVREALEIRPFLYVGYYFHIMGDRVAVFADFPRAVVGLQYPTIRWIKDPAEVNAMEAVRLGSVVLSMGEPPAHMEAAMARARSVVIGRLEREAKNTGARVGAAFQESAYGPHLEEKSMLGLARALRRPVSAVWGDVVVVRVAEALQLPRPIRCPVPRERIAECADTHAPTRLNDGRPPSRVVWAPNRPPQERERVMRVRRGANGRPEVYSESDRDSGWSDDGSSDADDGVYDWS